MYFAAVPKAISWSRGQFGVILANSTEAACADRDCRASRTNSDFIFQLALFFIGPWLKCNGFGKCPRTIRCGVLLISILFRETEPPGSKTSYTRGLMRESLFNCTQQRLTTHSRVNYNGFWTGRSVGDFFIQICTPSLLGVCGWIWDDPLFLHGLSHGTVSFWIGWTLCLKKRALLGTDVMEPIMTPLRSYPNWHFTHLVFCM